MQASGQRSLMDSLTLQHLLDKDSAKVELMPEKKGLPFLKHVQYKLTTKIVMGCCRKTLFGCADVSQRFRLPVHRRYNDFHLFLELLLQRFPYRMLPQLPARRMLKGVLNSQSKRDFVEQRRRGLERFIALVTQHPFLKGDEMVDIFLCASAEDVQLKMTESLKKHGDEFMTNQIATRAEHYLPADIQSQATLYCQLIGNILSSFQCLRDTMDRMSQRSHEHSADLLLFSKELSMLGNNLSPVPQGDTVWTTQRRCLRGLSQEFTTLAQAEQQGSREEVNVLVKLNMFLDLLQSYKELCERHEHSMLMEHQKALLQKSTTTRRVVGTSSPPSVAKDLLRAQQLESRLTKQENAIINMELRNYFSLLCLHQETQLILTHLPLATQILACFIHSRAHGHTEMGALWSKLGSTLAALQEHSSSPGRGLLSSTSPELPPASPRPRHQVLSPSTPPSLGPRPSTHPLRRTPSSPRVQAPSPAHHANTTPDAITPTDIFFP